LGTDPPKAERRKPYQEINGQTKGKPRKKVLARKGSKNRGGWKKYAKKNETLNPRCSASHGNEHQYGKRNGHRAWREHGRQRFSGSGIGTSIGKPGCRGP